MLPEVWLLGACALFLLEEIEGRPILGSDKLLKRMYPGRRHQYFVDRGYFWPGRCSNRCQKGRKTTTPPVSSSTEPCIHPGDLASRNIILDFLPPAYYPIPATDASEKALDKTTREGPQTILYAQKSTRPPTEYLDQSSYYLGRATNQSDLYGSKISRTDQVGSPEVIRPQDSPIWAGTLIQPVVHPAVTKTPTSPGTVPEDTNGIRFRSILKYLQTSGTMTQVGTLNAGTTHFLPKVKLPKGLTATKRVNPSEKSTVEEFSSQLSPRDTPLVGSGFTSSMGLLIANTTNLGTRGNIGEDKIKTNRDSQNNAATQLVPRSFLDDSSTVYVPNKKKSNILKELSFHKTPESLKRLELGLTSPVDSPSPNSTDWSARLITGLLITELKSDSMPDATQTISKYFPTETIATNDNSQRSQRLDFTNWMGRGIIGPYRGRTTADHSPDTSGTRLQLQDPLEVVTTKMKSRSHPQIETLSKATNLLKLSLTKRTSLISPKNYSIGWKLTVPAGASHQTTTVNSPLKIQSNIPLKVFTNRSSMKLTQAVSSKLFLPYPVNVESTDKKPSSLQELLPTLYQTQPGILTRVMDEQSHSSSSRGLGPRPNYNHIPLQSHRRIDLERNKTTESQADENLYILLTSPLVETTDETDLGIRSEDESYKIQTPESPTNVSAKTLHTLRELSDSYGTRLGPTSGIESVDPGDIIISSLVQNHNSSVSDGASTQMSTMKHKHAVPRKLFRVPPTLLEDANTTSFGRLELFSTSEPAVAEFPEGGSSNNIPLREYSRSSYKKLRTDSQENVSTQTLSVGHLKTSTKRIKLDSYKEVEPAVTKTLSPKTDVSTNTPLELPFFSFYLQNRQANVSDGAVTAFSLGISKHGLSKQPFTNHSHIEESSSKKLELVSISAHTASEFLAEGSKEKLSTQAVLLGPSKAAAKKIKFDTDAEPELVIVQTSKYPTIVPTKTSLEVHLGTGYEERRGRTLGPSTRSGSSCSSGAAKKQTKVGSYADKLSITIQTSRAPKTESTKIPTIVQVGTDSYLKQSSDSLESAWSKRKVKIPTFPSKKHQSSVVEGVPPWTYPWSPTAVSTYTPLELHLLSDSFLKSAGGTSGTAWDQSQVENLSSSSLKQESSLTGVSYFNIPLVEHTQVAYENELTTPTVGFDLDKPTSGGFSLSSPQTPIGGSSILKGLSVHHTREQTPLAKQHVGKVQEILPTSSLNFSFSFFDLSSYFRLAQTQRRSFKKNISDLTLAMTTRFPKEYSFERAVLSVADPTERRSVHTLLGIGSFQLLPGNTAAHKNERFVTDAHEKATSETSLAISEANSLHTLPVNSKSASLHITTSNND